MATRKQLGISYQQLAHTNLSDKYDFLYDFNNNIGYVALKDSDDWREIKNIPDEVRNIIGKMPEPNPEYSMIPLNERWRNKDHLEKMKKRILNENLNKENLNSNFFDKSLDRVRELKNTIKSNFFDKIFTQVHELNEVFKNKGYYRRHYNDRIASDGAPVLYGVLKKGGLISRNPINRFKLK